MRIAILGTRGIPARYGGFETFAEELSQRLAARGHSVTVWCRERHNEAEYLGVRLRYAPAVRQKYIETLAHTLTSTLQLIRDPHDVALYCNGANAIFTPLARMAGMPVALNVDGLERKRKKWNALARAWYLLSEILSTFCPTEIVTDAAHIRDYYHRRYGAESTFIAYGAPLGKVESQATLAKLGLTAEDYFLYVSRFEPENNALLVRQAFEKVDTSMRLALVGDAPYAQSYIEKVRDTRDPRILIPGAVYGGGYHELQSHSFAYIHATEVGGTHPALIEAMGRGALVLYYDTPENAEVAAEAGLPFSSQEELSQRIREVLAWPEERRRSLRQKAVEKVRRLYSWETVTDAYEALFRRLVESRQ